MAATGVRLDVGRGPMCVGARVDWLKLAARVAIREATLATIANRALDAPIHGGVAMPGPPLPLTIARPMPGGKYVLRADGCAVEIWTRAPGSEVIADRPVPGWTVSVEWSGAACVTRGWPWCVERSWRIFEWVGETYEARIQRIDLAADFRGLDLRTSQLDAFVRRARKAPVSWHKPRETIKPAFVADCEPLQLGLFNVGDNAIKTSARIRSVLGAVLPLAPTPIAGSASAAARDAQRDARREVYDREAAAEDAAEETAIVYASDERLSSVAFGRGGDVQVRIYDKTSELKTKPEAARELEYAVWAEYGWSGDETVTRVEGQIRGAALDELAARALTRATELRDPEGPSARMIKQIKALQAPLWAYLVGQPGHSYRCERRSYECECGDVWRGGTEAHRAAKAHAREHEHNIRRAKACCAFHHEGGREAEAQAVAHMGGLGWEKRNEGGLWVDGEAPRGAREHHPVVKVPIRGWLRMTDEADTRTRKERRRTDDRWTTVQRVRWHGVLEASARKRQTKRGSRRRASTVVFGCLRELAVNDKLPPVHAAMVGVDGVVYDDAKAFVDTIGDAAASFVAAYAKTVVEKSVDSLVEALLRGQDAKVTARRLLEKHGEIHASIRGIAKALPRAPDIVWDIEQQSGVFLRVPRVDVSSRWKRGQPGRQLWREPDAQVGT
jgi:hypothetical protein